MSNFENEFRNWAERQKGTRGIYTTETVQKYIKMLKNNIPQKLKEIDEYKKNLLECNDVKYLEKLYKRLLNGGDLVEFNKNTQGRTPSAAVRAYIDFKRISIKYSNSKRTCSKII